MQRFAEPFQQVMLQTLGNGIYPIIRDLGPITNIQLGPSVSPFNFTVQVRHQRGTSDWQFVSNDARAVIIAANLLSVTFAPIRTPSSGASELMLAVAV